MEERHAREIKEAEEKARAEAMEANPDMSEEDLTIKESDAVRQAAQHKARQAGDAHPARGPYDGDYGLFGFVRPRLREGANDNDGINDGLLRYYMAQPLGELAQGRNELNLIRARVAAERARLQAQRAQRIRADAVRVRLETRALAALQAEQDPPRRVNPIGGALGHGLGGHIAGHGVQAHVARRAAMYQGRDPRRAPQGGVHDEMAGYLPMPGAGRLPHHEAPAAAAAVAGAADDDSVAAGPDHVLGARNYGFGGGQQGLFDAFTDAFEGGNADDPFGYGRIIAGEHAPHRIPGLLGAHHARGRDAPAEGRARYDALAREHTAAAEAPGHTLPHMGNQAGGREEVLQPFPADPRRCHRFGAAYPGAPHAG